MKMNKMTSPKLNEKSWNPQTSYDKINKMINEWPDWKKDAYNKMFAVSVHAEKISIQQ